jgi:hypothetical protein
MSSVFDELIELATRLGITVRHAHLGGEGGGLAQVRNARQLFIDLDADPADQLERTARALADVPELSGLYLRPDVRRLLEEHGQPDPQ